MENPEEQSAESAGPDSSSFEAVTFWGIVLILVMRTFSLIHAAWPFDTDDAFITLRYSKHLAEGHGLVWNIGEPPVEGFSNFLHVLLGGAAIAAGIDAIDFLKISGVIGLGASTVLIFRFARLRVPRLAALAPVAVFTGIFGTSLWAVSGLETMVYIALSLGALYAWALGLGDDPDSMKERRRFFLVSAVLALLSALTRPEGPLVIISLCIVTFCALWGPWRREGGLDVSNLSGPIYGVGLFAAAYGSYFVFRATYFGQLLPNTVYCKAEYAGDSWALINPFLEYGLPMAVVLLIAPIRSLGWKYAPLPVLALLYIGALHGADPIIGYGHRHFLLAIACMSIASCVGAYLIFEQSWQKSRSMLLSVVFVGSIVVWHGTLSDVRTRLESWSESYSQRTKMRLQLGSWLSERMGPEDSVLLGDAGAIPFRLDAKVIDAFCLNNSEMTSLTVKERATEYIEGLMASPPGWVLVHSRRREELIPRPEYGFYPNLVAHPEFGQIYEYVGVFGAEGDDFYYWIFRNREVGESQ